MLPKHEEIRNRRDREFQARMLAAVEKPKPSAIWRILDSRLLSALLLGFLGAIIGGYYTNYQQCVTDASQLIEKRERLGREMLVRREAVQTRISHVSTAAELREALATPRPFSYAEYSTWSHFELLREFNKIDGRTDWLGTELNKRLALRRELDLWEQIQDGQMGDIFSGQLNPYIDDGFVSQVKLFVKREADYSRGRSALDTMIDYAPTCGLRTLLSRMAGNHPKIISASLSEKNDEMLRQMEEDGKRIDRWFEIMKEKKSD